MSIVPSGHILISQTDFLRRLRNRTTYWKPKSHEEGSQIPKTSNRIPGPPEEDPKAQGSRSLHKRPPIPLPRQEPKLRTRSPAPPQRAPQPQRAASQTQRNPSIPDHTTSMEAWGEGPQDGGPPCQRWGFGTLHPCSSCWAS